MASKTVLTIGDMHCGHHVGLCPPSRFQPRQSKVGKVQRALWDAFERGLARCGKPDILIHNGDAIEGKGDRSGGTELWTTDRTEQADTAREICNFIGAKDEIATYGTPYHTGNSEDFEGVIFTNIAGHQWVDINGVIFDCKHKVGGSSVPYARGTAITKEWVWNALWAEQDGDPRADIILRSHVHFHFFTGNSAGETGNGKFLAMTLPALQGKGSKFGSRQCNGTVDFGIAWFKVFDKPIDGKAYTWEHEIVRIKAQKSKAIKL